MATYANTHVPYSQRKYVHASALHYFATAFVHYCITSLYTLFTHYPALLSYYLTAVTLLTYG